MALTIYRRGRFWWLTGTVKAKDGEQRVHESTGETDEAAADAVRLSRENEAKAEFNLSPKDRFTFTQAVDAYLDAGKDDRFILPLLDHFTATRISDLTGSKVREAAKALYPGAVYTTWNRQIVTPMKAVINHSADTGDCHAVKIKGFTKKDRDVKKPTAAPKRAVDRSYIDTFRAYTDDQRLRALMLFLFQTGARVSEAIDLDEASGDLDLINRTVTFRDTKNGEDRQADLTIEMVYEFQQLAEWKEARAKADDYGKGARLGRHPNTRVFGFRQRWAVYKAIKATCEAAGIPYLGTHQPGRHSFATEMIVKNRVDVATTAKKGGWKDKRVLMDHYTHGDSGKGVIDKVFGKKKPRKAANAGDKATKPVTRPYTSRKREAG